MHMAMALVDFFRVRRKGALLFDMFGGLNFPRKLQSPRDPVEPSQVR